MERVRPEGQDPNEILPMIPALYSAQNIEDFLNGREQIIAGAVEDYDKSRENTAALPGIERIMLRSITGNPVSAISLFGKFKQEVTIASAFVAIPTVRHHSEQDKSKSPDRLTLSDARGECEVRLPDLMWSKILPFGGFRVLPEKTLKTQSWASDVLLFCNFETRNGKQNDRYYLVHASNRNIRGGGRMIPTLLAQLKAAGFDFNPQVNS